MNSIKVIFIAFFCTLLLGCATAQYVQPQARSAENSVRIQINRPSALFGAALRAPIYINGRYIGRLANGGQLNWTVEAGPVTVASSEGTAVIARRAGWSHQVSFQAQKGKSYYIQVTNPYQVQFAAPFFGEAAFAVQLMNQ